MTALRAYHSDPAVKAKYVNRMKEHIKADELVAGAIGENGVGCAVWCTFNDYDRSRYPVDLGIPEWLGKVNDIIYSGLPAKKNQKFALEFLETAKTGSDLEKIKGPLLIMVLKSVLNTFDHKEFPDIKKAIDGSIALWERDDIGSVDWRSAIAAAAGNNATATATRASRAAPHATAALCALAVAAYADYAAYAASAGAYAAVAWADFYATAAAYAAAPNAANAAARDAAVRAVAAVDANVTNSSAAAARAYDAVANATAYAAYADRAVAAHDANVTISSSVAAYAKEKKYEHFAKQLLKLMGAA